MSLELLAFTIHEVPLGIPLSAIRAVLPSVVGDVDLGRALGLGAGQLLQHDSRSVVIDLGEASEERWMVGEKPQFLTVLASAMAPLPSVVSTSVGVAGLVLEGPRPRLLLDPTRLPRGGR